MVISENEKSEWSEEIVDSRPLISQPVKVLATKPDVLSSAPNPNALRREPILGIVP